MLQIKKEGREELWERLIATIENYAERVQDLPVSPTEKVEEIDRAIARFTFEHPVAADAVLDFVADQLTRNQVHTSHRGYYGLFNPKPTTMGIAADTMVAAFNPQMAAWQHSPFAVQLEQHLVRYFGQSFGYARECIDGTFTSGGAEANHTAVLCALTHAFKDFKDKGLRALPKQPIMYVSAESHHSLLKAARLCGLGTDSVRQVCVNTNLEMDVLELKRLIESDIKAGAAPFLVVATAGTTNAGAIDPLPAISELAALHRQWLHVDAAWGGAAFFVPELKPAIRGIEQADSITFDCHKFMSVPMAAGLFLTKHKTILDDTFRIANDYMPKTGTELGLIDPYAHSMQWSRRFIGLKVFMSLAHAGWSGYTAALTHQTAMGQLLKTQLQEHGWNIVNSTPLPIVCCTDSQASDAARQERICKSVVESGQAWISTTRVGKGTTVLRACITNYDTKTDDVLLLVANLNKARAALAGVSA